MKTRKKYIYLYVWLETESGSEANKVASCVQHFLDHLTENVGSLLGLKPEKNLRLVQFSDASANPNKK